MGSGHGRQARPEVKYQEMESRIRARLRLITAPPGAGKTTAILAVASALRRGGFSGFYTEEMRAGGVRTGFKAVTFAGCDAVLADVSFRSGPRVGRYRVDVPQFEKVVVPSIDPNLTGADLFILDEIGKMECLSAYFVDCVRRIIAQNKTLVATVALKGGGLIAEVKKAPGVLIYGLNANNRARLPSDIVQSLRAGNDRP